MIPNSLLDDMNEVLDSGDAAARAALTARLSDQPAAQALWDALQATEHKLNNAPTIAPQAGFAQRFEARRNARHNVSGKTWFAFLSGILFTGGLTAAVPAMIGLAFYVSQVWMNELVFALIARNTVESGLTVVRALFKSVVAVGQVAIPNPLMWLMMLGAVVIVGVWLYLISKLTLEVSLT